MKKGTSTFQVNPFCEAVCIYIISHYVALHDCAPTNWFMVISLFFASPFPLLSLSFLLYFLHRHETRREVAFHFFTQANLQGYMLNCNENAIFTNAYQEHIHFPFPLAPFPLRISKKEGSVTDESTIYKHT